MANDKATRNVTAKIIKARQSYPGTVEKAESPTQLTDQENRTASDWLEPPIDLRGLKALVKNSTILPQCIRAYRSNIAGFGIAVRYREDIEEQKEMAKEFEQAARIVELLNTEQDTKEVFEDLVEARETYGIAYLEIIRSVTGEVQQIDFIQDTPSIRKTRPLPPYVETTFFHNGEDVSRKKKYRKYRQTIGGKTVYFKEFGDPRIMDNRTGQYASEVKADDDADESAVIPVEFQANEIMEFAIGTEPYGEVRWIGQMLGVSGSRKAEGLNNNYFENGRHTPLMIMIEGGTLTDDSFAKLQEYMQEIKGEAGQHAFIVLETEAADSRTDFDQQEKPKITVKDLASILQKDELFQDYLDNNRRKVQSSFLLPDIYTGYTTEFNRATAQTAQEITEEQVFQPERLSLAWAINNRLLNEYRFQYVEVYFKAPDISNPDDIFKILTVCNNAGGLTPNKAKDIIYRATGEEAEDFPEEWGNIPLQVQNIQRNASAGQDLTALAGRLQKQIEKAEAHNDDAIVAVMKEVKSLLVKMSAEDE